MLHVKVLQVLQFFYNAVQATLCTGGLMKNLEIVNLIIRFRRVLQQCGHMH